MAFLTETETYEPGIYQWETTDPVEGGVNGIDNVPTTHLANRTKYLKAAIDALRTGVPGTVGYAFAAGSIARSAIAGTLSSGSLQRNTVVTGGLDAVGVPNYMSVSSTNPPVLTLNPSGTPDLILGFADGFDASGDQNVVLVVPGASALTTNITGSTGTVYYIAVTFITVLGVTSPVLERIALQPVYSRIAPPSPANGQSWFDLRRMQMYQWNTGTNNWDKIYRVFVGETQRTGTSSASLVIYPMRVDYGMGMIPVGTVVCFKSNAGSPAGTSGGTNPNLLGPGWACCDSRLLDTRQYPELFAILGYSYGGSGTNFRTPSFTALASGGGSLDFYYYIRCS